MNKHFAPRIVLCTLLALAWRPITTLAQSGNEAKIDGQIQPAAMKIPEVNSPEIWKDPTQPIPSRVHDLVSRMSLEEKASQIQANPPAIPRLGIPAYSHRNECLHGASGNGVATVFPQAIGMAATWDTSLIQQEADAIAIEARAKHNDYIASHDGNTGQHAGLNFYSPNINIYRDPRWGRGQETYGEDPFLTAQMGIAFVRGLQGDDLSHAKTIACAKHFAVHSGPEKQRHRMSMTPSERDLYETYLPAFEALVTQGHVGSVMGAYSALDGKPCCANEFLLTDILRKRWGFNGVVFSDGGAIGDIWAEHHYVPGPVEAAAAAVKAGCDVSSGSMGRESADPIETGHDEAGIKRGAAFSVLPQAVQKGLVLESQIDAAVTRELIMRMRLGMFDPPDQQPLAKIGIDQNDTPEHRALALKVAQESIVMLKNDGLLPLDRAKYKRIAVIGPNADAARMQFANDTAKSSTVTLLEGIKKIVGGDAEVVYERGCPLAVKRDHSDLPPPEMAKEALDAAKAADLIIFVSGLDISVEKEEGPARLDVYEGFSRGDRLKIDLPAPQKDLIKQIAATGKPMVLVNCSGGTIAMPWEAEHVRAIVQAWYPGEEGGTAVAEVLFGQFNPAGRLPVTAYASVDDLPAFEDYSMANRTYRYFKGKPLFAFGHGLSYTQFDYTDAKLDASTYKADSTLRVAFALTNTGRRDGDEVAQVYFRHLDSPVPQARLALCAFTRVHVTRGENAMVRMDIPAKQFCYWDTAQKQYVVEPGHYELLIGGASDDIRLRIPVVLQASKN